MYIICSINLTLCLSVLTTHVTWRVVAEPRSIFLTKHMYGSGDVHISQPSRTQMWLVTHMEPIPWDVHPQWIPRAAHIKGTQWRPSPSRPLPARASTSPSGWAERHWWIPLLHTRKKKIMWDTDCAAVSLHCCHWQRVWVCGFTPFVVYVISLSEEWRATILWLKIVHVSCPLNKAA